jgi:hypothetical protein
MSQSAHPPRIAPRQRTFRGLEIDFGAGGRRIACTARDWSVAGAQVELPAGQALPPRFRLVDPRSGEQHEARLVWRRGNIAGLAFTDGPNAMRRPAPDSLLGRMLRAIRPG